MATKKKSLNPVVVRTYSAGAHFGYLVSQSADGKRVELTRARRLWSWKGANTLSEIATSGVGEGSRIAVPVDVTLTDAIEIISATPAAVENLEKSTWAR